MNALMLMNQSFSIFYMLIYFQLLFSYFHILKKVDYYYEYKRCLHKCEFIYNFFITYYIIYLTVNYSKCKGNNKRIYYQKIAKKN